MVAQSKLEGMEMSEGLRFSVSFNDRLKFISGGLCVGGFQEFGKLRLDSGRIAIFSLLLGTPGVLVGTGSSCGFVKLCDGTRIQS